jgi:hypothetical protein
MLAQSAKAPRPMLIVRDMFFMLLFLLLISLFSGWKGKQNTARFDRPEAGDEIASGC